MENGTMAVHVGPVPTEEDMSKLQDMFKRALDSIVSVSSLSAQVAELTRTVNTLKLDVESYREQNLRLDEALRTTRSQRDEAEQKVSRLTSDLATTHIELDRERSAVQDHVTQIDRLKAEVESLRSERDQYGFEAMQAHEELNKATETIDKFKSMAGSILAQAQAVANPPSTPYPEPVHVPEPYDPPPYDEPSPTPAAMPLNERYNKPVVDFDKPYHWDDDKNHYVNTPEPAPVEDLPNPLGFPRSSNG